MVYMCGQMVGMRCWCCVWFVEVVMLPQADKFVGLVSLSPMAPSPPPLSDSVSKVPNMLFFAGNP